LGLVASTLSVIVPARDAAHQVDRCARSVLDQTPTVHEIIVVDDCSRDETAAVADALDVRVVSLPARVSAGAGRARNAGARVATGEVLVFLDSDDEAEPGWAAALAARFDGGADIVAGGLHAPTPRTLTEWFIQSQSPGHDLTGRRTRFLPLAISTNLAVRREVFEELGGFDPSLAACEDADFSYRAQFRGYRLTPAPEAGIIRRHRSTALALMRQRARNARGKVHLRWKYQRYPFHVAPSVAGHGRILTGHVLALARAAIRWREDRREFARACFDIAVYTATCAGDWYGKFETLSGIRQPPEILHPSTDEETGTATPLARSPEVLLIGDDVPAMRYVANALGGAPDLAIAPPIDADEAVARWEEPPPWSLRLARQARRAGWRIPVLPAAKRIEWARPTTWGEAFLILHALNAWLRKKDAYGLAVTGPAGPELARRLPEVPLVVVGKDTSDRASAAVVVTREDVLSRPREAVARVETVVGRPFVERPQVVLPRSGRIVLLQLFRATHGIRLRLRRRTA
jgi:GT2 family glycosyltransferase